jgi:hypothetical protein
MQALYDKMYRPFVFFNPTPFGEDMQWMQDKYMQ